jgi:DNA-binding winged helix-turn-helix (wHTH) protein/Tol biopolymer transport system component
MRATQSSSPVATGRPLPLVFGPFRFDTQSRLLSRDGTELALPPRVLGVLELLLQRAGEVVSRQELIDTVWKDAFVTDTSLAEAVSVLRQVLGDDPQSPTYVQTLHRRGYRFVAPVSVGATPGEAGNQNRAPESALEARVAPSIGGQLVPWSVAVLCAVLAIAAVWQSTRRNQGLSSPAARFAVAPAAGTTFDNVAPALAISADGRQIAWSGCDGTGCRIYCRPVDRLDASPLSGTDDGRAPFFSPDGQWIGFFADGRLKRASLAGGAPVTIADAPTALGGVWIDHEIVFAGSPSGGLMRVSADGGEPRLLTTPRESDGEVRHTWPSLVPGRRVLLFTIEMIPADDESKTLNVMSVLNLDRESASWQTLVAGASLARAAAPDVIVFARDSALNAIAFDPLRLVTTGAPRAVVDAVATSRGRAHYALSTTGSLVYATATSVSPGLSWWSPSGAHNATDENRRFSSATLAPDGTRLAGSVAEGARADIWVADVTRGVATRLTHNGINTSPIWSANGQIVYYASRTGGAFEIWNRSADGSRPAARLFGTTRHAVPLAASPDGSMLAFLQTGDRTGADIWTLPLAGGQPRPLVQGPFDERAASFSPDSRLLAYQSSEAGRWEIYVQRLDDGRRTLVSTSGGERPFWSGNELYYQSAGQLMRVAIGQDGNTGDLRVGQAAALGGLRGGALQGIASNGRVLLDRGADFSRSMAVVNLEWLREARSLLGPPASALPR